MCMIIQTTTVFNAIHCSCLRQCSLLRKPENRQ